MRKRLLIIISSVVVFCIMVVGLSKQANTSSNVKTPSKTTQEQSPYKKYGYNIDNGLPKYKKALKNISTRKVKVYCIGESITRGEYSSDEVNKSWVGVLKSSLQNKYGNAGEGFISIYEGALPSGTKPRWKLGNGWIVSGASNKVVSNVGGFGGCFGTSAKNISPASVVFTGTAVDLLYAKASDGGTAVVTIDGKKVGTISCLDKTVSFSNKVSYSGLSNTTHKLVITPNTKSSIFIEGITASSNKIGIEVDKIAISSKRASYFNTAISKKVWNVSPAPDLILLCFGFNESAHGFSVQEYKANMIGLVNYWQSRGSNVCLVIGPRPADSWTTNWPAYATSMYEIANTYNTGIVDIYKAYFKDYTAAQKSGFFGMAANDYSGRSGTNTAHPSDKGYKYIGDVIYSNLQ